MGESILATIRKMLNADEFDNSFDVDIIVHINSSLSDLARLGVGPKNGLFIRDESSTWSELTSNNKLLSLAIEYIYLSTKLVFDPPPQASVVASMETRIGKLEWCIGVGVDETGSNVISENL